MIRKSLTNKLIFVFSGILIAVVLLNIVFNGLLLPRVHRHNKISAMTELYNELYAKYNSNAQIEDIISSVKLGLDRENFRVYIWDKTNHLVIDSLPLSHYQDDLPENAHDLKRPHDSNFPNIEKSFRFNRAETFLLYADIAENDILKENENYLIFLFATFDGYEEKNLCLRGYFPGEYKILIRLPYASVNEAITISNALLLIVGIIMLIIGIVIVAFTSRTIAKPVKELSGIAKAMEQLDFSRKYTNTRTDEIGSLGESINSLSEKLKATINELFEKNQRLELDIELKSRIDTMRKEFIANASHELKTPVALISGYAEGLRDNIATTEEARRLYTDVIIEEADKMDHIIRQMLDLMELDGTDTILTENNVSLNELVDSAINAFDIIINRNNIRIITNCDPDCIVCGDYFKLYQAIINYISNAVNHVDKNKLIQIRLKKSSDKITFSVYNTGITIPDGEDANIWERFYKVDKAHTREYGGTGLGLSIVKSIIELHKGEYGFENRSDGVEFYFKLKKGDTDEI